MGSQLPVLLDGLLVVCHRFLGRLHALLCRTDTCSGHVQLLAQLQLRLPGVLLQLVIHLIYGFLQGHKDSQAQETWEGKCRPGRCLRGGDQCEATQELLPEALASR